jgi:hypothetical protein
MGYNLSDEAAIKIGKAAEDAGWGTDPKTSKEDFHKHIGLAAFFALMASGNGGAFKIAAERVDHFEKHGWDLSKDADYANGELMVAAGVCMALYDGGVNSLAEESWPWQSEFGMSFFHKIAAKSKEEQLVIAGSFIASEIDRINGTAKV